MIVTSRSLAIVVAITVITIITDVKRVPDDPKVVWHFIYREERYVEESFL